MLRGVTWPAITRHMINGDDDQVLLRLQLALLKPLTHQQAEPPAQILEPSTEHLSMATILGAAFAGLLLAAAPGAAQAVTAAPAAAQDQTVFIGERRYAKP